MNDGPLIIYAAHAIVVGMVGYLLKITSDVRDTLRAINGRMGQMETWRAMHEKQDDERHEAVLKHVDRLDCTRTPSNGQ